MARCRACLTTILDEAVDDGHLERNPARSRRMRVKVPKPARTFLEMDELVALTDAAGEQDAKFARPKLPVKPASGSTAAKVAERWLAGKRAFEISDELGLARATVTYHLRRMQAKDPGYYIGRRAIVATLGGSGVRVSELCDIRIRDLRLHAASGDDGRLCAAAAARGAPPRRGVRRPRQAGARAALWNGRGSGWRGRGVAGGTAPRRPRRRMARRPGRSVALGGNTVRSRFVGLRFSCRMGRVADYVIELLAEILEEQPAREIRFPWAVGDPSAKTGRSAQLPFDAVWESRRLIVEVDEDQHRQPVPFWDKPDVVTVSGVSRGEQRRIYDMRKRAAAREHEYTVVEVEWERRPRPDRRDRDADRKRLVAVLGRAGVLL